MEVKKENLIESSCGSDLKKENRTPISGKQVFVPVKFGDADWRLALSDIERASSL